MRLEIENKGVIAEVDRVEDFIENKLCKVVIKIIQQDEVDGQPVQSFYNIVEAFPYNETWEDDQILLFAKEKVNKRFADLNLSEITEVRSARRATIIEETPTIKVEPVKKKLSLFKRFLSIFKRNA